jgi:phytoene synthase
LSIIKKSDGTAHLRDEHEASLNTRQQRSRPHIPALKQNEALFATHGKTFHFAARFFPLAYRDAVVALYAFFRTLDDLVDERPESWQAYEVRQELDAWRGWLDSDHSSSAPREPLGTTIAALLKIYQIPIVIFHDFLDGLSADLEPPAIQNFRELYQYCYRVAGTVGLAMTYIFGVDSPQARTAAMQLGIAMQLTNILRDIGSDLKIGRTYLPINELERCDCSWDHLLRLYNEQRAPDERFRRLMRSQVQRARYYYQESLHGVWLLPPDCRLPVLLAGRLYQGILTEIEREHYNVLHRRVATSFFTKIREATIVFFLDLLWKRGEIAGTSELELLYED